MGHGGKITHDCNNVIARRPFANETVGAVLNIITANPFEAGLLQVQFVESHLSRITSVQVFDPAVKG